MNIILVNNDGSQFEHDLGEEFQERAVEVMKRKHHEEFADKVPAGDMAKAIEFANRKLVRAVAIEVQQASLSYEAEKEKRKAEKAEAERNRKLEELKRKLESDIPE